MGALVDSRMLGCSEGLKPPVPETNRPTFHFSLIDLNFFWASSHHCVKFVLMLPDINITLVLITDSRIKVLRKGGLVKCGPDEQASAPNSDAQREVDFGEMHFLVFQPASQCGCTCVCAQTHL